MRCILDRAGRVALLAAVVIPSLNFVALAQEPTQLKRLEFESESDDILLHEYSHHVMARAGDVRYPGWFREGFAEYFATATVTERERPNSVSRYFRQF